MQCKTRQYRDTGYKLTGRYGLVPVATRVLSAQQTRPAAVVFISVLWPTHRVAYFHFFGYFYFFDYFHFFDCFQFFDFFTSVAIITSLTILALGKPSFVKKKIFCETTS